MENVIAYPSCNNKHLQYELFKKREFHVSMKERREKINDYEEKAAYRTAICRPVIFKLEPHQALLANFINPRTPYKGLLLFQGVGTGKTGAAITIAEGFKGNVEKYGNKIMVLVPGPLNKDNFKREILKFTGETYKKYVDPSIKLSAQEQEINKKIAMNNVLKYYSFSSYNSFYKKVLGERIIEKDEHGKKLSYRKSEDGEYLREESNNRIESLDNTLLVIDEVHNVIGNQYGDAIEQIINNSKNLKIIGLSATPMKNLGDDIIPLINFLRPKDDKIKRDKVFTSERGHKLEFTSGGQEYLANMVRGYVSYLRGADPLTFAKRNEIGEIHEKLIFTKTTRCYMKKFQLKSYEEIIKTKTDSLDRRSEAIANIALPILDSGKKIIGVSGKQGLTDLSSQLKSSSDLSKKINEMFGENVEVVDNAGKITGTIFKKENLENFSSKFYRALVNLEELIEGKRGPGLAFVYSNLVTIGINIFKEILEQNGYLEYDKLDPHGLKAKNDTVCYYCGTTKKNHAQTNSHTYHPARYISITGTDDEQSDEQMSIDNIDILDNIFNSYHNRDGKYIKCVLGSKVMNEGITLENIKDIHILDVWHNLGRIDQVIGRGLRFCKHYDITTKENPEPQVNIYKYVISIKDSDELTTDEDLYRKAEQKYLLIKKVERILIENAVDCAIHRNSNIFPEEKEHDDCEEPTLKNKGKKNLCPAVCGYNSCNFMCADKKLLEYYDKNKDMYKFIDKKDLDYSTFNNALARSEIEQTKSIIKGLFKIMDTYTLGEILKLVKYEYSKTYLRGKENLFDDFFVFQGLDEMTPISENDFNNFKDTVVNKYNIPGYLIFRSKYYIFQPFGENEDVPLYYRSQIKDDFKPHIVLNDYIETYKKYVLVKKEKVNDYVAYDFDYVLENYYDKREEYDYVGVIDKIRTKYITSDKNDVFKIRPKRKIGVKQRGTDIHTLKGTVCETKEKTEIMKVAKSVGIETKNKSKMELCEEIKKKMLDLEKYSTGKDKKTYVIIPKNHPIYEFPYNLEDRVQYKMEELSKQLKTKDIIGKKKGDIYVISVKTTHDEDKKNLKKYPLNKDTYEIVLK